MSTATILALAVALGTDAFSMAMGMGITGIRKKYIILISGVVLFFHILMPLLGLFLGSVLGRTVGGLAGIIGAAVLIIIGLNNILNSTGVKKVMAKKFNIRGCYPLFWIMPATDYWGMLVLAACVSLDALAVGFGLGAFNVNLTLTVVTFGIVAGIMTAVGFVFGGKIGNHLGDRAEFVGAWILVLISLKRLVS